MNLRSKDGSVRLTVERLRWPWVRGHVQEGSPRVAVDLRQVTAMQIQEPDIGRNVLAGAVAVVVFIVLGALSLRGWQIGGVPIPSPSR